MQLPTFDHLAIRVSDRVAMRDALLDRLDWRVFEETERLTLLGASADHGKLTLLDAEPGTTPVPARLVSLVLASHGAGGVPAPIAFPEGLLVTFAAVDELGAEWADTPDAAVVGVSMRAADPPIAAARLEAEHGMHIDRLASDVAVIDVAGPGSGRITLHRERWDTTLPRMVDHVGVRVEDAERWRERAERDDIEVVRWVEAPHSRAVFVNGPDELLLEFVELTRPLEPA